jgi:hypothetical protein
MNTKAVNYFNFDVYFTKLTIKMQDLIRLFTT